MIFVDGLQLENAREPDFAFTTKSTKRITAEEILRTNFKLKDTITIPIGEKDYVFVVEHIRLLDDNTAKVYFVAKDIYVQNQMNLDEINRILDAIEAGMPRELVEQLADFEHLTNKGFEMTRRVNLLSLGNFQDTEGYCVGKDDIIFDGFCTSAERVKNFGGEYRVYWTCTPWRWERSPGISGSTNFSIVGYSGHLGTNYASNINGVVPGFSILCFT